MVIGFGKLAVETEEGKTMTQTKTKKAYDVKVFLEKLKEVGLDVAEDAAAKILVVTFDWVQESAKLSENKIDDIVASLLDPVKAYVLTQIDKIDGKVG